MSDIILKGCKPMKNMKRKFSVFNVLNNFRNWLLGVLPLVIDRETTLAEKCIDSLEEVILHNVVPFHRYLRHSLPIYD